MATMTSSSSSSNTAGAAATGNCPAALELVRPLQPLLAGFAHRNKNQHRGARWFASFAMLRRHVDKLADETAARAAAAAARPPKKKKKKQQQQPAQPHRRDEDDDDDNDDDGPAPRRARWLRDVLVPKCYLAFSQLAADNQFATLGVVLLGALAQVQRACVCLVGEGAESTTVETTTGGGAATTTTVPSPASALVLTTPAVTAAARTTTTTTTTNKLRGAGVGGSVGEAFDVGEAVSRDALVGDRPPKKRKKPAAGSTPLDAGGAGPGDPPARDRKEADVKPAKKKKKAKKGDEFDDLFNSLF